MRDCQIVQEKLSLFMDDQLSLSEKRNIEAHLATCQLCSREYERLRRIVDILHSLESVEIPSDFRLKLHQRLLASRPQNTSPWKKLVSRPWLSLGAVAAGFLLLVMTMSVLSPESFSPENFFGDSFLAKSVKQDQAVPEMAEGESGQVEVLEKSQVQVFDLGVPAGEEEPVSSPAEEETAEMLAAPPPPSTKHPGSAGVKSAARNGSSKPDEIDDEMTAAALHDDESKLDNEVAGEEISLFRGLAAPGPDVVLEFQCKDLEKALLVIEDIVEDQYLSCQITVLENDIVVEIQIPSREKDMILDGLKSLGEPVKEEYHYGDQSGTVKSLEEKMDGLFRRGEELQRLLLEGGSSEEVKAWQGELKKVEEEIDLIGEERAQLEKESALIHVSIKLIRE